MYFPRYHCARTGVFLLASVLVAAAPAIVQARSSFNNGLTSTISQVVNLIADGSEQNQPRWEIRELRQALNQLLNVLEGHQNGHQHGMGKGMMVGHHHKHHHHKHGNIGAKAGNKNNAGNAAPVAKGQGGARNGIGNAPGKNTAGTRKPASSAQPTNIANKGAANRGQGANGSVGGRLGNNKNTQNKCNHAAFGNAKPGGASSGKAGAVVAANTPKNATRGISAGKSTIAPPTGNVVKVSTTGVAVKKANGLANPVGLAAVHQNRLPTTSGRQFAGASVGLRNAMHVNPIRRR